MEACMKSERILAQLKSLPLEVQASPECQDLIEKLENPCPRLSVDMLEQSPISRATKGRSAVFDKETFKMVLWLLGELIVMVGAGYRLYTYADTSLSALRVGELADIIVCVVVFCWMVRLAWKTVRDWRD
jgi:hypothetical protein